MHKQMTLSKELIEAGITLQQPQLMTTEVIKKMCSDLIKLNDDYLEKHGLVNYQYGVLEDQIIESKSIWNMLMINLYLFARSDINLGAIICLDILENYGSQQAGQQMLSIRGQVPTSRPG
jgi:hypothetical protein